MYVQYICVNIRMYTPDAHMSTGSCFMTSYPDPVLIVSVSKILRLVFDVQTPSSSQRRLTAGAGREADGPRQDAANLTSLSPFQALRFNQPSLHKLLWSTFEITLSAQ